MKTSAIALSLLLAASGAAQAASITTLDAVQVRPAADQLAQAQHEQASAIPTLAAVQVHPSHDQYLQRDAELAAQSTIVTLATVQVRPDAELHRSIAEQAASASAQQLASIVAALTQQVGQLAVSLPAFNASAHGLGNVAFDVATGLVRP